ncbi:MAG TPA: CoA-binding protein [Elusimicrobia bacterium]|nr:MAG: hypothetical protein A2551_01615 [Elusimicrobia bacterium RIFOXYD2_FULL_34_30]HAM37955.1 CoA-binding protein [Elusimicrobiota bacterium]
MENIVKEFLEKKNIAVAGSFKSKEKVAYRILLELIKKGYNVFPINPNLNEIEGIKCYGLVNDIPVTVDAIDIVTPPEVTEKIVEDCKIKGIKYIWMQPGAESEKAIKFCENNNIKAIYNMCLLVKSI